MDLLAAMPRQTFSDEFVIGLALDQYAKAYHYQAAAAAGVINDNLGVYRIVLIVNGESIHAYLRQVGGQNLTFTLESEILKDEQTGTTWDVTRGRAIAGALRGEVLQPVPWVSAYDWAWLRFHPESAFYYP